MTLLWNTAMASGENAFLEWLRNTCEHRGELQVPLGDDAAVWTLPSGESLVLAADVLAEGCHFETGADPHLVGRKALAVNLSDLAAMGAEPICALATCALPAGFGEDLPRALTEGLRSLAVEFDCPLVGGDTVSHAGGIVISVSVLGRPLPGGPITRAGASVGDLLAITGPLGGSGAGRHLTFRPRLGESRHLLAAGPPSAMIDVSDGLLIDLHRLADASGVGFRIMGEAVPVHPDARDTDGGGLEAALADGEDFELLFSATPESMDAILRDWAAGEAPTVIGVILAPGTRVLRLEGQDREAPRAGYEHT